MQKQSPASPGALTGYTRVNMRQSQQLAASGFHRPRSCRCGLTLAEVAISTLIVGLMMVASLKSVGGVYTTWTMAADKYDGLSLADQLLSEIMQSEYEEPDGTVDFGREQGEPPSYRTSWDDVDDYDGWSSEPPQGHDGWWMSGLDGWTRTSTVQLASIADPTFVPASDEGLKLITVTVTDPDGNTTIRQALRSRWGSLQQAPLVDSTWVTEVDVQLTTGSGASTSSAASIPNAAEDF
mgnify:CR=1 FL=1|jgi:hypothetical protein